MISKLQSLNQQNFKSEVEIILTRGKHTFLKTPTCSQSWWSQTFAEGKPPNQSCLVQLFQTISPTSFWPRTATRRVVKSSKIWSMLSKQNWCFFSENTMCLMWLMWCCKPSNTSFSIQGRPLIVGLFTTLCLFKGELRIGKTFDLCDLDKSW